MQRILILLVLLPFLFTATSCYKDELGRIEDKVDRNHEAILDLKSEIASSMLVLEGAIDQMKDEVKDHNSKLSAIQVELLEATHREVRENFAATSARLDSLLEEIEAGDNSLEVELLRSELMSHLLEIQNQYLTIERIVANNDVNKDLLEIIIGKLDELLARECNIPEVIIVRDTIEVEGETIIQVDTIYQNVEVPVEYEVCDDAPEKVSPVFEGYDPNTNEYIWGYMNRNTCIVLIPHGGENKLTNGHGGESAQVFLPGRKTDVFRTPAGDGNTVWTLKSPNGKGATSTANRN